MGKKILFRTTLITLGTILALIAGFLIWYEMTSYRPADTDPSPTLLTGATVLTGPDLTPEENTEVLIEDGRITALGPDLADTIAEEVEIRDLSGMTLMPGLIDLHVHLGLEMEQDAGPPGALDYPGLIAEYARYLPQARHDLLAAGVTTVRDLGNEEPFIFELRAGVDDGSLEGPRVLAAGQVFTTAGGHPVQTVHGGDLEASPSLTPETPEQARAEVRRLAGEGADLIKVIQERGSGGYQLDPIPVDILSAIVEEAHAHDLRVAAHWGRLDDLAEVRTAGVDELVHLESRDLLDGWPPGLLAELSGSDVPVTASTVVALAGHPPELREKLIQLAAEFHESGGTLLAGSDAGMPGVGFGSGLHGELAILVEAGLSPTQALQAATTAAARHLERPDLGEIREGALADLIAVEGRPHVDIAELEQIHLVLREGREAFSA